MLAFSGMPAALLPLVEPILGVGKDVVFGVGPLTYALTWKGDLAEAEGYFATRPDSSLRAFLGAAGGGGANDLAAYLPADAFMISDFVGDPTWPAGQISAFAEKAFGEGVGNALTQIFGPTYAMAPKLSGRSAFAMRMQGMMGSSPSGSSSSRRAWTPRPPSRATTSRSGTPHSRSSARRSPSPSRRT
jgi:hypothetical protein